MKRYKRNPEWAVLIYERVLRIEAQKTQPHRCDKKCLECKHRYYHDFKDKPLMLGLKPGDVITIPPGMYPILLIPQ